MNRNPFVLDRLIRIGSGPILALGLGALAGWIGLAALMTPVPAQAGEPHPPVATARVQATRVPATSAQDPAHAASGPTTTEHRPADKPVDRPPADRPADLRPADRTVNSRPTPGQRILDSILRKNRS